MNSKLDEQVNKEDTGFVGGSMENKWKSFISSPRHALLAVLGFALFGALLTTIAFAGKPADYFASSPQLSTPPNGTVTEEVPTFTWEPLSKTRGYEIQIAEMDDQAFQNPQIEKTNRSTVKYTPESLTKGSHIWRVRALGLGDTVSPWSSIFSFTYEDTPSVSVAPDPVPTDPTPDPSPPPPPSDEVSSFPSKRDPFLWPFSADSVWNMPLHKDAKYQLANINTGVSPLSGKAYRGLRPEQDIIIMAPDAPIQSIYRATETWGTVMTAQDRCNSATSEVLLTAPLPNWFKTSRLDDNGDQIFRIGLRPNHGAGLLMSDGRTTRQTQPFERCDGTGSATSTFFNNRYDADIYNDAGTLGTHGGSGLSVIGGVIKLGELVPDGVIHHAIKINLMGNENYCSKTAVQAVGRETQYLWPAIRADWSANNPDVTAADGTQKMYQGTNPNLCPGSLLALPQDFNIDSLNSEPARIIATALRDYGGYVVDGTGTEVYHFAVEWGIRNNSGDGDSVPQEFERTWGYPFETDNSRDGKWSGDVRLMIDSLNIITNNGPDSIGGGPNSDMDNRLAPMAPEFGGAGSGHVY